MVKNHHFTPKYSQGGSDSGEGRGEFLDLEFITEIFDFGFEHRTFCPLPLPKLELFMEDSDSMVVLLRLRCKPEGYRLAIRYTLSFKNHIALTLKYPLKLKILIYFLIFLQRNTR